MTIPFNVPCFTGNETSYVREAIENGHISGNGPFTRRVHAAFAERFGFEDCLLTTSCTTALEMAAMLCEFKPGDEVILPSFTHVGTANAFERAGATLVFADSLPTHPNLDPKAVEALINPRTRAIVLVHYAGVACDMNAFTALAERHGCFLIEDAAHALGAWYKGKPLGSFGHFAAFSFHETKNITCGQGGLLVINAEAYAERAAILWENGTNRKAFYAGEVDYYTWVDKGSCFLPSDMNAAYLYGQLQQWESIQAHRSSLWSRYDRNLRPLAGEHFTLPDHPDVLQHNAHIFYLTLHDRAARDAMMRDLNAQGINAVFHYIPLHSSPHFSARHGDRPLPNAHKHSDCILRLPLHHALTSAQVDLISKAVAHSGK